MPKNIHLIAGWNYKGDKAKYSAIHMWLKSKLGMPTFCSNKDCIYPKQSGKRYFVKPKRYEWSNIDHKYKRNLNDYVSLCPSCHRKYDNRMREAELDQ